MTLSLRAAQSWGVATKVIMLLLSVAQTAIVLRILSPAEYGVVGIVVSLGALVGVTQHMGIVDATIREISVASSARARARVFWVSLWMRLAMIAPVAIILVGIASWIGTAVYPFPQVPELIRIMGLILIIQGIQGVLGGAYTGRREFRRLYALQTAMAVVNVPVFTALVWYRGTSGYFEAMAVTSALFVLLMAIWLRPVLGSLYHPSWQEMKSVVRAMLHTGVWTYVAKLVSVGWQRIPVLVLGWVASPDVAGLFHVATTFGSKIMYALGIGEVNLAYLSDVFTRKSEEFRQAVRKTLSDVSAAVAVSAGFLTLFAPELLRIVAGEAYDAAASAVVLVTWGYALYTLIDVASHTAFVPARQSQLRALGFGVMAAGTVAVLVPLFTAGNEAFDSLTVAAWAVLAGGLIGTVVSEIASRMRLSLPLFSSGTLGVFVLAAVFLAAAMSDLSLMPRIALFVLLAGAIGWLAFIHRPEEGRGA